jgi:hypothetical protein
MILIPRTHVVTPATFEPVTAADMKTQLGLGAVQDQTLETTLDAQLGGFALAARIQCEKWEHRVYAQQTRMALFDRFPRHAHEFDDRKRPVLRLPDPPFVAVVSVQYVDLTGTLQTLPVDTTYGTDPNLPPYAYQLSAGTETLAARLRPAMYRWWPPTLWDVDGAVQVQYVCGYASVAAMPGNVLLAIKLLAQFFYEQGGVVDQAMPRVVMDLLSTPTKG